jgi:hypothetical protein
MRRVVCESDDGATRDGEEREPQQQCEPAGRGITACAVSARLSASV